jgi:hypothetical protein
MLRFRSSSIRWSSRGRGCFVALALAGTAAGQSSEPLQVRAEVAPSRHFAGQGFELVVAVVAADMRPRVDLPQLAGARVWMIGTEFRPISASSIGPTVAQENLFLTRLRVVANRAGALEIPAIRAQLDNRSGRSRPLHLTIERVPLEGRPAEFLGGIGPFSLLAEAVPKLARVGQEIEFRIKVSGPAAWGITGRPELRHYERLTPRLTIAPRADEVTDEPPSRTFVYRIRLTRAGELVLPPVAIAAFDPAIGRYITRVTPGVPIRAVAVAAFDPSRLNMGESRSGARLSTWLAWAAWVLSATALVAAFRLVSRVRSRLRQAARQGPAAARRHAARLARSLDSRRHRFDRKSISEHDQLVGTDRAPTSSFQAARIVSEGMIRYLELGMGRPPGALTPDEASESIAHLTGSDDLAEHARQLTAWCDVAMYRNVGALPSSSELLKCAQRLFAALSRVKTPAPRLHRDAPILTERLAQAPRASATEL